jgi:FAD/FMN-containing dehydrogenase
MVRKYGLTVDSLLSVELVTADGRLLHATTDEHPDPFWALRGGGGNFGVATAFQFRLHPAGTVVGGGVVYPATLDVLRGWADYVVDAPDELTSMALIMPAQPAPFIPAEHVGKLVAVLAVVYVGDVTLGQRVVAPLRQLGTPVADSIAPMPYPAMLAISGEVVQPKLVAQRSGYMERLDDDVLAAMLEHAGRMPVRTGQIELRGLGGAMARFPADATAFAHRDKPYMVTVVAAALDRAGIDRQREWTENLWNVLRPHTRGAYVNFMEDEGAARVREAYSPATYQRLLAVKRDYDPNNVFRLNQNIA